MCSGICLLRRVWIGDIMKENERYTEGGGSVRDNQESRYQDIRFVDSRFPLSIHVNRVSAIDNADRNSRIFHEELEIKYFYEGCATLMVDTAAIVVQPGDIVVVNPYEFHSTVKLDEQKAKYHLFMVGLDCFTALNPAGLNLRRILLAGGVRFNTLIRGDAKLNSLLERLVEEKLSADEYSRYAMEALIEEFFIRLLRTQVNESGLPAENDERIRYYSIIDPAVRCIHTEYARKISIDELAGLCSVSKYHFCRVFKQATGVSAIQYLMRYRLRIAHALLNETDRSIAEIAWNCGFSDENYFYRCYKKQYGDSPWKNRATSSEK